MGNILDYINGLIGDGWDYSIMSDGYLYYQRFDRSGLKIIENLKYFNIPYVNSDGEYLKIYVKIEDINNHYIQNQREDKINSILN